MTERPAAAYSTRHAGPRGGPRPLPVRLRRWLRLRVTLLRLLASRNIRDNSMAIAALGMAASIAIAGGVILLHWTVYLLHTLFFGLPLGGHLSAGVGLGTWQPFAVPVLGGLALGVFGILGRRLRARDIVDPIEANALYGGKMSMLDSLRLAASTLLSNAAGASVGMEAAYTQVGAAMASVSGQTFNLRRADLRILVGCGAAAAIAAAFGAPFAGAFYAFELVIGSYTLAAMAPVCLSAITAGLMTDWAVGGHMIFATHEMTGLGFYDYPFIAAIGIGAAFLGIWTMRAVTLAERLMRRSRLPAWARPVAGGLIVGTIALSFPQVLGSGYGAVQHNIHLGYTVPVLAVLVVVKIIASAASLGAGFRGGLFSSSLFLGSLYGALFAAGAAWLFPSLPLDESGYVLIGMGAVAAAIVGAPITMVMLVQEATGDFEVTLGVLAAVVVATMIVRQRFGYSFATWRFHLRGVQIHGAHDVGWIENLTVRRLMRRDPKIVPATMSLQALRRTYPLGSVKRVFVIDEDAQYAGMVDLSAVHDPSVEDDDERTAGDLATAPDGFLLPMQNVRRALKLFGSAEEESLPVVESARNRHIVGYLTEAYALRRYNQELERKRAEELGERHLFG